MKQNKISHNGHARTVIAITGGIGGGKSTVGRMIKEAGYTVLSCDDFTPIAYKSRATAKKLKKAFPSAVEGKFFYKVNKKKLAQEAFGGDDKYKKLSEIVTPAVFEKTMKKAARLSGTVFVEVPLLYEFSLADKFDKVLVVARDKKARIESVKKRSDLTEDEVLHRMNKQIDYDTFDFKNAYVINNDGKTEELKKKITDFLKTL